MPFHLFDTTNFNIISNLIHKRPTQKTKDSSIRKQALSIPPNPSKIHPLIMILVIIIKLYM
jgi:hypothetical protein